MTHLARVSAVSAMLALAAHAPSHAQVAPASPLAAAQASIELPALVQPGSARIRKSRPVIRTIATVAASAGGFALAREGREPDDIAVPMLAGAGASAVAAWLFSDAPTLRIVMGSVLSILPAGAAAYFTAGSIPDEEQGIEPVIVFAVPHGLLTSLFAASAPR